MATRDVIALIAMSGYRSTYYWVLPLQQVPNRFTTSEEGKALITHFISRMQNSSNKCVGTAIDMDPITPRTFYYQYHENLQKGNGLLLLIKLYLLIKDQDT
ncbi:hypothetical protein JHK87_039690 [Glycine soja]|nr:hypothetical protein JHK87_039690 [Glycine soja]